MYTNKWIYEGKEIDVIDIPDDAIGFMYCITNQLDGKRYIGKKLLTRASTKQVKGKKVKIRVESDWREYYSSSPYIIELLTVAKADGVEIFKREILMFAKSKGELNYFEEACQYKLGVLETDTWMNANIRSRIFKKHVMKYDLETFNNVMAVL
jgi:Putative endonuclease segE, GIY-YIG domain